MGQAARGEGTVAQGGREARAQHCVEMAGSHHSGGVAPLVVVWLMVWGLFEEGAP